jgi:hypothetical protein
MTQWFKVKMLPLRAEDLSGSYEREASRNGVTDLSTFWDASH